MANPRAFIHTAKPILGKHESCPTYRVGKFARAQKPGGVKLAKGELWWEYQIYYGLHDKVSTCYRGGAREDVLRYAEAVCASLNADDKRVTASKSLRMGALAKARKRGALKGHLSRATKVKH
jgi:hypothetical protein